MTVPRIRQCAAHLAREFHDSQERKRLGTAFALKRVDWNDLPGATRTPLVEAFYSLAYRGIIVCPVPGHRISVELREKAEFPATWGGGHALVIEFGDEELTARCQCGTPLGAGTPATSLESFSTPWERHVMAGSRG